MGRRVPSANASPLVKQIEAPRPVTVERAFWIAVHETTSAEYQCFCDATGRSSPSPGTTDPSMGDTVSGSLPVVNVSWDDAVDYCRWLSVRLGRRCRLPTEIEWEYACRGLGTTASRPSGSHPAASSPAGDSMAGIWHNGVSGGGLRPVETSIPNAAGLYDMRGNVWEWCSDQLPPEEIEMPSYKKETCFRIRGGSYANAPTNCDCGTRWGALPRQRREPTVGFRVVIEEGS